MEEDPPADMEDHPLDDTDHHHLQGEHPLIGDMVVAQHFLEIGTLMFTDLARIQDQDQDHTRHDHVAPRHDGAAEATAIGKRRHQLVVGVDGEGAQVIRATRAIVIVVAAGIELEAGMEEIGRGKGDYSSEDG